MAANIYAMAAARWRHDVCRRMALILLMGSTVRCARTGLRPRGTINATRGLRSLVAPADLRRLAAYNYLELAKLTASDAAGGDQFGHSVAIDGATIVVGTYPRPDSGGSGWGAAYVFRTSDGGATYGQVAKLTASDAAADDQFGRSVAIDGDTIVAGANYDDDDGVSYSGSAYVFRTSDGGATYPQVAKLTAADAAAFDEFGRSVAIDGGIIVAGAPYDSGGSVYVFSPPAPTVQPTPRPTWTFQPTPQPTVSPKPTTPQPSTAALGSDSATRAGGTLATALLAFAATALAL